MRVALPATCTIRTGSPLSYSSLRLSALESSAYQHTPETQEPLGETMHSQELTVGDAYREVAFIRALEERVLKLSQDGEVAGSVHLALGQEAIPVGAVAALADGDRILATYRGHGWAIASGAPAEGVLGEILQREDGVNGGRSGSPLLSHPRSGFLGENSIVGAGVPISSGVALASELLGTGRVVVTSFGDGAMNQGATTEGMVFAAARNLPVIFVCE